ncbi:hypothetical protein FRC10_010987 [Ceratobasidium sp. 414]|nr:hypothetical protein FRC10_010987 [Ceratobasidium sp. 414]
MFGNMKKVTGGAKPTPFTLGLTAVTLPEPDIARLATTTVLDELKSQVKNMHVAASAVHCIQPCLNFAIFGVCRLADCNRLELGSYELGDDVRQTHFNERLRAHILQVLIIHLYQDQDISYRL